MTAAHALPLAAIALLVPWSIYRRIRRSVGRQPFSPLRLKARTAVVLAILALVIDSVADRVMPELLQAALALAAGSGAGVLVGLFALRHTRFERAEGASWYVPHPWIGTAVSMLFIARMAWRCWHLWPVIASQGLAGVKFGPMAPLTVGILGLVLMYYATYHLSLLRKGPQVLSV